jgi:signal transduction histidine kinase
MPSKLRPELTCCLPLGSSKVIAQTLGRMAALCFCLGMILPWTESAQGALLWSHFQPILVRTNGLGHDVLKGAVGVRDDTASGTLYIKFRVEPRSDIVTRFEPDRNYFLAGLVLFYRGVEKLGIGNAWDAWGYSAFSPSQDVPGNQPGEIDLSSANPEHPPAQHEAPRRSIKRTLVVKIEYVPEDKDRVTVWLNPDLSPGANEYLQNSNIVTRFRADASFDEIRLCHRGAGEGWIFSDLALATAFEDFVPIPFWERKWVISLSLVVLCGSLASLVVYQQQRRAGKRIRELKHEQALAEERTRIARDLHDDLGVRLTEISLLAGVAESQESTREQLSAALRQASKVARETSDITDGIVWSVDPHNDSLQSVADYLVQFAEQFFQLTPIRCRFDVPTNLPDQVVSSQFRHHLLLAVKEACNNAVRHSAATEVWLKMALSDGTLAIVVEDNGRGFDPQTCAEKGNGLRNLRARLANLNGRLEIQSAAQGGARLSLVLPLPVPI